MCEVLLKVSYKVEKTWSLTSKNLYLRGEDRCEKHIHAFTHLVVGEKVFKSKLENLSRHKKQLGFYFTCTGENNKRI